MAVAMAMGNCNGNSDSNGDGNGVGNGNEMATAMAMAMATARATIAKEGLPLHVAAMCSAFGWATPCLHPHGHKESAFTSAASWG